MTARVLVVDDIPANVKLLEARLNAEYFEVLTAENGLEALEICDRGACDLVLLDVMMPGMDGFEVCRRLKAHPKTSHLPVIMVTALDQVADRVKGLQAGADDFLTKPIDEVALIARVRSSARLKVAIDELRARAATTASLGGDAGLTFALDDDRAGRILVADDRAASVDRIKRALLPKHEIIVEPTMEEALRRSAQEGIELVIVSLGLSAYDPLRLCSQLRAAEITRPLPILVVADLEDKRRIVRGLEIGVNDYIVRPVDANELAARVRTQLRQKRYAESLRRTVENTIELALVDSLTQLHNRRFFESHLGALLAGADQRKSPMNLMILDIDHFKRVNDTYGHAAGDEVLREFARRVRSVMREGDLLCRLGGEEFVAVMPRTPRDAAIVVAERARDAVEREPFVVGNQNARVTVSVGLAEYRADDDAGAIYRRADRALYRSKGEGRNRVTADAA